MTQLVSPKQIILVTGATGNQGGSVARHLLNRGKFKVRALVRDENKPAAQALKQAGAELAKGNFDNLDSLKRAMQGVYGVFSMQDFRDGVETEVRQGNAVADAAKAARVQHFVYSSVGSAERNTGIPHFDSKFQVEEYVRAIELPYTILRPVFFFYNYSGMKQMAEGGKLLLPLNPETKLQQLLEENYGAMVAELFEHPADFSNQEIEVASVEMTMTEVAIAFGRVLGKPVEYQQIPFEAFEQQAGKEVTIMFRWFETDGYKADLTALKRDFELSDLETYLRDRGWKPSTETVLTEIG